MEFIFECFFEDTLEQLVRNGLHERSARRDVLDHLNAIIGGCSDGQCMNTDEVARIAVLAAVRYHRDKKDSNGDVCLMGKYHNILYIALRTCWDWSVRDSAVVVVLLEEIYSCEKTFERLFLGALFGTHAPHFIAGWRSDFRDQDENTRAMVYFLHHATSLDMSLPVWIPRFEQERMVKFVDIPIESCGCSSPLRVALQASAPDLLLILLRYGAEPNPPDGGSSVIFTLFDRLLENGRNYVFQLISCLQILLRNIPQIEIPYKPIAVFNTRREMFFQRYGKLLIDNIVKTEQVYGVMSLRHLCRCRIRDLLRRNGQLPDGIDTLRLPRRLQRYIDLMEEIEDPEPQNDATKAKPPKTNNNTKASEAKNRNVKKKQVTFTKDIAKAIKTSSLSSTAEATTSAEAEGKSLIVDTEVPEKAASSSSSEVTIPIIIIENNEQSLSGEDNVVKAEAIPSPIEVPIILVKNEEEIFSGIDDIFAVAEETSSSSPEIAIPIIFVKDEKKSLSEVDDVVVSEVNVPIIVLPIEEKNLSVVDDDVIVETSSSAEVPIPIIVLKTDEQSLCVADDVDGAAATSFSEVPIPIIVLKNVEKSLCGEHDVFLADEISSSSSEVPIPIIVLKDEQKTLSVVNDNDVVAKTSDGTPVEVLLIEKPLTL